MSDHTASPSPRPQFRRDLEALGGLLLATLLTTAGAVLLLSFL